MTAVIATCLVSPVALGLFSGWTVSSSRRAELGLQTPQQLAHHGVWLALYEWMKNGLQSPLLFCCPVDLLCAGQSARS